VLSDRCLQIVGPTDARQSAARRPTAVDPLSENPLPEFTER
jgi:hypothetical protein